MANTHRRKLAKFLEQTFQDDKLEIEARLKASQQMLDLIGPNPTKAKPKRFTKDTNVLGLGRSQALRQ